MTFRHTLTLALATIVVCHSGMVAQPPGLRGDAGRVLFVENAGQWHRSIALQGRAGQTTIALDRAGVTLAVPVDSAGRLSFLALRTTFVGARMTDPTGEAETPGTFHYPKEGIVAGSFRRVRYDDLWSGVDLLYHTDEEGFKYDFLLDPGVSPSRIGLRYDGPGSMRIDRSGDLLIDAPFGRLREKAPVCYQIIDGERRLVVGRYRVIGHRTIGFAIGAHDRRHPLVIDPCLSVEYATYFGGGGYDVVTSMATDSSGVAYVTGFTRSPDFPLIPRSGRLDGRNYVFVSKISSDGRTLLYSTAVGIPYDTSYFEIERAHIDYESIGADVEVTASGEAVVAMSTNVDSLPTTTGAIARRITVNGSGVVCPPLTFQNVDIYVARFTTTGSLKWGTYLGGVDNDYAIDLALDGTERPSIVGISYAPTCGGNRGEALSYPVTPGTGGFNSGETLRGMETIISVLAADGRSLLFSALYGGAGNDVPGKIGRDVTGRLVVVGSTQSNNLPTTSGAIQSTRRPGSSPGSADLYIARVDVASNALEYSTYICDNGAPRAGLGALPFADRPTHPLLIGFDRQTIRQGLVMLESGDVVIGGTTRSPGLPATGGAFQGAIHNPGGPDTSGYDAFVMRLNLETGTIIRSTYIGGSNLDLFGGLAIDRFGDLVVGLSTASNDFPLSSVNVQGDLRGNFDAALVTLTADLATQTYGTFIGGSRGANRYLHEQSVFGTMVDPQGGIYVYGGTSSYDLPVPSDAIVKANDYYGGYIFKFSAPSEPKIGVTELAIVFEPNTCGDPTTTTFRLFNSGQSPMRIDSLGMKTGQYFAASARQPAPFTLAPCDTTTVTITFNGANVPCRRVVDDLFYVVASNAVAPRVEIPVQGRRTCVYFTVQDSTIDTEYKLGSGDKAGFPVFVYEREPTQYVTIRPDPSNTGYFTPVAGDSTPWPVGTSSIAFNVSVPDTGYYCERFTATVEPCGRVIPLELCLWVRSGIFQSDTAIDLGLISCRNLEIPLRVMNVGNDTLSVRVSYVDGPATRDIVFDPSPDQIKKLGIGQTTIYPTFIQAKGFGKREATIYFWTDEGSREGNLRNVPVRYELDSVAFSLTTQPGTDVAGFGDTIALPVTYEPLLEGRLGVEELTLYARFDPSVLAFVGMSTEGTKMAGWEVARDQHVDSGAIIVLRVTPQGNAITGGGQMTRLLFQSLRGDTTASTLSIRLTGVSAGCFTGLVDQGRLFELTAECAAQLRLLRQGRRTLLRPIAPNPVLDVVVIGYHVPVDDKATIVLYDVNGHEVVRLLDDHSSAGIGEIRFDVRAIPPGLYYCRITVGRDFNETTPMVIAR